MTAHTETNRLTEGDGESFAHEDDDAPAPAGA